MNAESLISERVIWIGIVSPEDAARGCGEVKEGLVDRHVFRGFAFLLYQLGIRRSGAYALVPGLASSR